MKRRSFFLMSTMAGILSVGPIMSPAEAGRFSYEIHDSGKTHYEHVVVSGEVPTVTEQEVQEILHPGTLSLPEVKDKDPVRALQAQRIRKKIIRLHDFTAYLAEAASNCPNGSYMTAQLTGTENGVRGIYEFKFSKENVDYTPPTTSSFDDSRFSLKDVSYEGNVVFKPSQHAGSASGSGSK